MTIRLAFQIAVRHLVARKRQTTLAVLGVIVGGGVFSLMVAITAGQQEFLEARLIDISPHILVKSERLAPITAQNLLTDRGNATIELRVNVPPNDRDELKPYTELLARVESSGGEVAAVAPYVAMQGVFRSGTRYQTVTVRGIQPEREKRIARLAADVERGRLEDLNRQPDGVLIGTGLARKLRVDVGSTITFITPGGALQSLKVMGLFESGVANFDDRRGYINLALAQTLRGMPRNAVTGLSVQVRDLTNVDEAKRGLERLTGYRAETWQESNVQILEFQARQRITSRLLVVFVFVTAAFGIANTLVTIVLQKKQDIAVMKAFGVSRRQVALIFLFQGAVIGLIGGLLAAAAGYGMASLFSSLQLFPQNNDRAFVRFDRFPVSTDIGIYLFTFATAFMMSVLAGVLPARRAARFVPVQIIRGEI